MKNATKGPEASKEVLYTNSSGSTIASGSVVDIGNGQFGIANGDIADGKTGTLHIAGEFRVAKTTGISFAKGDRVGWDAGNKNAVHWAPGITHKYLGVATSDQVDADTEVHVTLGVEPRSPAIRRVVTAGEGAADTMDIVHGFKAAPGAFTVQVESTGGVRRSPQGAVVADATKITLSDTGLAANEIVHITF